MKIPELTKQSNCGGITVIKETLDNNGKGTLNDKKIAILKENFPNCFSGDTLDIEKFKREINQEIDFSSEGNELSRKKLCKIHC